MTPTHSATGAGHQQTWTSGLRVGEVVQAASDLSKQPNRIALAEMAQTTFAALQSGWKWLERKRTLQLSSRRLRLSETISLGEKRSVSIVQVDGAQFLIGCSAGSVQLLAVLDKNIDGIGCSTSIGEGS